MTIDFLQYYGNGQELFGGAVDRYRAAVGEKPSSHLAEIMTRHGSDKATWHNYPPFYEAMIALLPNVPTTILEIGIGSRDPAVVGNMGSDGVPGASLRAWRDYFPQAQIYGADSDTGCLLTEPNICTFYLDQNNPETINHVWSIMPHLRFDLVIDDGAHTYVANSNMLDNTFARMRPGGLYIIEDIVVDFFNLHLFDAYFKARGWDAALLRLPYARNDVDNAVAVVRPNPPLTSLHNAGGLDLR